MSTSHQTVSPELAVTGLADAGLVQAAPVRGATATTDGTAVSTADDGTQVLAGSEQLGLVSSPALAATGPTAGVDMASWLAPIIIGAGLLAAALRASVRSRRRLARG